MWHTKENWQFVSVCLFNLKLSLPEIPASQSDCSGHMIYLVSRMILIIVMAKIMVQHIHVGTTLRRMTVLAAQKAG